MRRPSGPVIRATIYALGFVLLGVAYFVDGRPVIGGAFLVVAAISVSGYCIDYVKRARKPPGA